MSINNMMPQNYCTKNALLRKMKNLKSAFILQFLFLLRPALFLNSFAV